MRRWLTILLLTLLPFQSTWAASASYCQHETRESATHFGHHAHQHQGAKAKVAGSERGSPSDALGAVDDDCAVCHLSAVAPIASTPLVGLTLLGRTIAPALLAAFESHVPRVPVLPDRALAVRFGESISLI